MSSLVRKNNLFGDLGLDFWNLDPWEELSRGLGRGFRSEFSADIKEKADRVEITADLPGVTKDDIDISLEDGVLSIQASRNAEQTETTDRYVRKERHSGSMTRSFRLTESLDPESVTADLSEGVLKITIKKIEKSLPKKIPVN